MKTTFQTVRDVSKVYLTTAAKMLMIVPITVGIGLGFICGFSIYLLAGVVLMALMLLFAGQEREGTYSYDIYKSFTITDSIIDIEGKSYNIDQIMTLRPSIEG
jgi:hypothetical protein